MAYAMYDKGVEGFLKGEISWNTDTIKACLVDTNQYTPDLINHDFLNDIPVGARTSISPALTGKTVLGRVVDADNVIFPSVVGPQSEALVLFKDTGVEGTSRLIAYMDSANGLPVTPAGSNISIVWDNGANKIFRQ